MGHSFTHYVYDNNATYDDDGTETAQCDHGCGLTDTRTKVGSKLIDEAAPAVEGVKTYACTVCGQVLRTESVAKLPAPTEPTTSAVPTGDTGDTGLWMGLAALCGMSLAALLRTGKRKEQ